MTVDQISADEMNILCTGLALLANDTGKGGLTKIKRDPYDPDSSKLRILCTDGRTRRIKLGELQELNLKVARLAGHEIDESILGFLRGTVRGRR